MISHSLAYKEAIQAPVKTADVLFFTHDTQTGDDVQIFQTDGNSISLTAIGSFNNSGSKKITAQIIGNQSSYLNQLLRIDFQVKTPTGYETINLGYYTVYTVSYDISSNISSIDLYDQMYILSLTPYSLDDSVFPCTVADLASAVAVIGGVTLDPNFASLPNSSITITTNLWKTIQNVTYRDIVNEIAQTTGTTAITSGESLLFKTYTVASEGISEPNLISFTLGQKWGNVNSVNLSRQPQQDNIVERDDDDANVNGVFEVEIDNNQIMDGDRQTYIQPIYNSLVGVTPYLKYYDSTLNTEGHGWYEVGDLVIATLGGIEYPIFVTEVDFSFDGGISESVISVTPTDPSANPTTSGGILKTLYNTQIQVDKQNNDIISVVDQQNTYESYVNDNFTEIYQDIDDITLSVQDGGGVNQIKNSVGYSLASDKTINFWEYIS